MPYRKALPSEISILAGLKMRMFVEVGLDHLLRDDFLNEVEMEYRRMYAEGKAQHFVAEAGGQIVACAGAFIKEDIPYCFFKEPRYGFIGDVYVDPAYRNRGFARTLTGDVLDWLKEQGVRDIRLLASPNARKLYESLGFRGTDEMLLRMHG